jgi:hypothetical protein
LLTLCLSHECHLGPTHYQPRRGPYDGLLEGLRRGRRDHLRLALRLLCRTGHGSNGGGVLDEQPGTIWRVLPRPNEVGVMTLVQQLQVAGVDGERLIRVTRDDVSATGIDRPLGATIGPAGEGVRLARGLRGP